MADREFELDLGGRVVDLDGVDLLAMLGTVATEIVEFIILSERSSGRFVQAAGAYGLLTIEYQSRDDGRIRHERVCRDLGPAGEERRPPKVSGYLGYLEKEVMPIDDAIEIFESFLASVDVPSRFPRRDITAELGLG